MRYAFLLSYYLSTLLGRKRPLLGGVKLTHDCNLGCIHCPFRQRKGPSLSFNDTVAAMADLHSRGVRIVIFEGGEPFLWRDGERSLGDVVSRAREVFFSVGVTTNGTFPIDVDADIVWVSIDGLKATHDKIRGESFDTIMGNIASSSHGKIYAHITINSLNCGEVAELVEFLAGKVTGITVQFHYPYEEIDEKLCLSQERREEVLDRLIALKRRGLPLADSYACLKALKRNRWHCRPWMIASVDPDGAVTHGCYLQKRGPISCERCGFAAHTEISLAYGGHPGAIALAGKIFG